MSKSILFLSFLALSLFASADSTDDDYVKKAFAVGRGSIQGLAKGYYMNPTFEINEKCMADEAAVKGKELYEAFMSGEFLNLFKTFSHVYQLNYMIEK